MLSLPESRGEATVTDGFTLQRSLEEAFETADELLEKMHELGYARAEAERNYRIAKQERILFERNQKNTPVSIINDVVKGYVDIAELKLKLDCAEADYSANYEALLFWKKRIDSYREQMQREWSQAGMK